jgi:hypothetical protein
VYDVFITLVVVVVVLAEEEKHRMHRQLMYGYLAGISCRIWYKTVCPTYRYSNLVRRNICVSSNV